jgi:hypothetical protein
MEEIELLRISNHGALDATKKCLSGCTAGSIVEVASGTKTRPRYAFMRLFLVGCPCISPQCRKEQSLSLD